MYSLYLVFFPMTLLRQHALFIIAFVLIVEPLITFIKFIIVALRSIAG